MTSTTSTPTSIPTSIPTCTPTCTPTSTPTCSPTSTSVRSRRPSSSTRVLRRMLAGAAVAAVPLAALGGAAHADRTFSDVPCDSRCVLTLADNDGDGFSDGYELAAGTSLIDAASAPSVQLTQEGLDAELLARVSFDDQLVVTFKDGLAQGIDYTVRPDGTKIVNSTLVDPRTGQTFRADRTNYSPESMGINAASQTMWFTLGVSDGRTGAAKPGQLPGQSPEFEPPTDDRTLYGADDDTKKKKDGDTGTKKEGDTGTKKEGDTGTKKEGDTGTKQEGDTGTKQEGDTGTKQEGGMQVWEATHNPDGSTKETTKSVLDKAVDFWENVKCGANYSGCVSPSEEKAAPKPAVPYKGNPAGTHGGGTYDYTDPDADTSGGGGPVDTSEAPVDPRAPYVMPVPDAGAPRGEIPAGSFNPNETIELRDPDASTNGPTFDGPTTVGPTTVTDAPELPYDGISDPPRDPMP